MNPIKKVLFYSVLLSFLLISCKTTAEISEVEQPAIIERHEDISRLINSMPADNQVEENWVNEQLSAMGPDAVLVLSGILTDPATGNDVRARYALSSLANYVARPGAENEKREFESALLIEIQKDNSVDVKRFLISQLRLTGSNQSVPVLENYLADSRFSHSALEILLTIRTDSAVAAVRNALPLVDGNQKVALIKALGELEDAESSEVLSDYASSDQWPIKRISLFSLSEIGQPGAVDLFKEAISQNEGFRKNELTGLFLNYSDKLIDNGHNEESGRITNYFLEGDFDVHIKSSALNVKFGARGEEMLDELLEWAQSSDQIVAVTSLKLINSLPGEQITNRMISAMENAPASQKVRFLDALSDRNDRTAIPSIRNYLDNENRPVRIAAFQAIHQLDGNLNPSDAIRALNSADHEEEVQAIETVLNQMKSDVLVDSIAEAWGESEAHAKPVLINVLRKREAANYKHLVLNELSNENEEVRIAALNYLQRYGEVTDIENMMVLMDKNLSETEKRAIQHTFVSVLNRQDSESERISQFNRNYANSSHRQRARLIEASTQIDGLQKPEIIRRGFNHSYSDLRNASTIALLNWEDPRVLPLMIEALSFETDQAKKSDIIGAYIHIVNTMEGSESQKVRHLQRLADSFSDRNDKAAVISRFNGANEILALQSVRKYFLDNHINIREAAYQVAADILQPHYSSVSNPGSTSHTALAVLDETSRQKITDILDERAAMQQDVETNQVQSEPKFGPLFNGENLNGWVVIGNNPGTWGINDGILFTDGVGSGWLSTTETYDNFILELEYRVPEGGNSGVFIRAPRNGNPAYQGLEIQILDDYADRYANLQPWQYTGSIYDVIAPSKRVTKTAGEWQKMKIRADGPRIQVTLNGEMILNANLIHHQEKVDGHPGITRRSGYIGLQNHSDRVDFRNITIQPIP